MRKIIFFLCFTALFSFTNKAFSLNPGDISIDPGLIGNLNLGNYVVIIPNYDFYLGACSVTRVTNNDTGDYHPNLQGTTLVWTQGGGSNYSIFKWNINSSTDDIQEVPDSGFWLGGGPSTYNGKIAWSHFNGIQYYNGSSTSSITTDTSIVYGFPSLYGTDIAYDKTSDLSNYTLVYKSGISETNVYTASASTEPSLYNGQIAFQDYDGNDYEIYFWDGSSITQITNNDYDDMNPSLYDGAIAWQGKKNSDWDIFYYNSNSITQITHSGDDINPSLYNGKIAFEGTDGSDKEIFEWDGSSIIQVTSNAYDDTDPTYYNGYLAWVGNNENKEIYFCELDVPQPPTALIEPATNIGTTTATFNGSVNPNGYSTTYYFQYGITTAYGGTTPTASAGSGTETIDVSANVSSLMPDTTYHYRLVAVNANGTKYSNDQTFTTSAVTIPDTPAPSGQSTYSYLPVTDPETSTDPASMKPLGVGNIAGGVLNLKVALPKFSSAVDVYLGVYSEALDPNTVYLIVDGNEVVPLAEPLETWQSNLDVKLLAVSLYGDISLSALPSGTYTFYVLVTPHGSIASYYLWSTSITF